MWTGNVRKVTKMNRRNAGEVIEAKVGEMRNGNLVKVRGNGGRVSRVSKGSESRGNYGK